MDTQELNIEALEKNLPQVLRFVDDLLELAGCPVKTQLQIDLAVEEIFVNIADYAYAPGEGSAVIRAEISENPRKAVITFFDRGIPYDPLEKKDPDVTLSAGERPVGGLGIFLTKKSMDEVTYAYKDGQNVLTMIKRW